MWAYSQSSHMRIASWESCTMFIAALCCKSALKMIYRTHPQRARTMTRWLRQHWWLCSVMSFTYAQYHSNSVASCPGLTSFKKFDKSSSLLGRQMEAAHCARTTSVPSTTCACSFGCPCCSAGGSQYLRHHPACKMRHLLMPHQQVNSSPRDGGILSAYGYGLERPYTLYVHYQHHTT